MPRGTDAEAAHSRDHDRRIADHLPEAGRQGPAGGPGPRPDAIPRHKERSSGGQRNRARHQQPAPLVVLRSSETQSQVDVGPLGLILTERLVFPHFAVSNNLFQTTRNFRLLSVQPKPSSEAFSDRDFPSRSVHVTTLSFCEL